LGLLGGGSWGGEGALLGIFVRDSGLI